MMAQSSIVAMRAAACKACVGDHWLTECLPCHSSRRFSLRAIMIMYDDEQ
jgi:hypothetical protein